MECFCSPFPLFAPTDRLRLATNPSTSSTARTMVRNPRCPSPRDPGPYFLPFCTRPHVRTGGGGAPARVSGWVRVLHTALSSTRASTVYPTVESKAIGHNACYLRTVDCLAMDSERFGSRERSTGHLPRQKQFTVSSHPRFRCSSSNLSVPNCRSRWIRSVRAAGWICVRMGVEGELSPPADKQRPGCTPFGLDG